jgi:hypothetical protein
MKEYEPAEAEVGFKAQLEEGENHILAANNLMQDAKIAVIETALKGNKGGTTRAESSATATAKVEAPAETAEKRPRGRPPGTKKAPVLSDDFESAAPAPAPAASEDFDTPTSEPLPEVKSTAPAPIVEVDEFGEPINKPEPVASEAPMSVKDLQDWVAAQIQAKKIDAETVKKVYAKFGFARSTDTTEESRPKIKAAIAEALK